MQITATEKIWFIRGVIIAFAVCNRTLTYDQLRRICRLCDRQLGSFLGKARTGLAPSEPDFCVVVQKTMGAPGAGWGNPKTWAIELQRAYDYWRDRSLMDNTDFVAKYGSIPSVPGDSI